MSGIEKQVLNPHKLLLRIHLSVYCSKNQFDFEMALQESVSPVHTACLSKVYITLLFNAEASGSNYGPRTILVFIVSPLKRMSQNRSRSL